jgi:hypothetical protein
MKPREPSRSARTPIWEEPVRGFYIDPGQFVTLSGLELLRTMLDGGLGPPIRYLFGLAPTAVEPSGATFTMPVTDWLIHRGRSMAIGTSDVFDADGKKVAVATGSSVILPGRPVTVATELRLPDLAGSEDD